MASLGLKISEMTLDETSSHAKYGFCGETRGDDAQYTVAAECEMAWRTPSLENEFKSLTDSQESGYGTLEGEDFDESMDAGYENSQSETTTAGSLTSTKQNNGGDCISINNNSGILILDLGSKNEKPEEKNEADSGIQRHSTPMRSLPRSSVKRSLFTGCENQASAKRIRRTKSVKRVAAATSKKYLQTKIPFPRHKRRTNVKSLTGTTSGNDDELNTKNQSTMNILVNNNSGSVVIGDGATCYYGSVTGEVVTADGSHPNMVMTPKAGPVVLADKSTIRHLNTVYSMIKDIYPLRENGRWDKFYNTMDSKLLSARNRGLVENEIFLMIEKGIGLSYQKKNAESLEMITEANNMIANHPELRMREFLLVLSHCQLAALYRRENKTWKANEAVFTAQQNAKSVPSLLAKAYMTYEKASNQTLFLSIVSTQEPDRAGCADKAKNALKECISVCERMLQENDGIYLRKQIFSLLKLALMNLNCRTTAGRSQSVKQEDIREAEDCIQRMQNRYKEHISEAISVQLHTAQCDLCFRRGMYSDAEVYGRIALQVAEKIGFQIEIHALQERLQEISLLKQQSAVITEITSDSAIHKQCD